MGAPGLGRDEAGWADGRKQPCGFWRLAQGMGFGELLEGQDGPGCGGEDTATPCPEQTARTVVGATGHGRLAWASGH